MPCFQFFCGIKLEKSVCVVDNVQWFFEGIGKIVMLGRCGVNASTLKRSFGWAFEDVWKDVGTGNCILSVLSVPPEITAVIDGFSG